MEPAEPTPNGEKPVRRRLDVEPAVSAEERRLINIVKWIMGVGFIATVVGAGLWLSR